MDRTDRRNVAAVRIGIAIVFEPVEVASKDRPGLPRFRRAKLLRRRLETEPVRPDTPPRRALLRG